MLGAIDLVMGSFSKTFASNGGFVATNSNTIAEYLKMFSNSYMFSNALSPIQAAVVCNALKIVRSAEGDSRRESLQQNAIAMIKRFSQHGIQCMGEVSPIVPVPIGGEAHSRLVYRDLQRKNIAAMVIEFPIVAVGQSRLRIQLMANHTVEQVECGAYEIARSILQTAEQME
jgi:glycine C-acetyltransferase